MGDHSVWRLLPGSVRVWNRRGRVVSLLLPHSQLVAGTPDPADLRGHAILPLKTASISPKLDRLGIQLTSLTKTWWSSSGSIKEINYTKYLGTVLITLKSPRRVLVYLSAAHFCLAWNMHYSSSLVSRWSECALVADTSRLYSHMRRRCRRLTKILTNSSHQLSDLLSGIPAGHDIALLGDNARIGADVD